MKIIKKLLYPHIAFTLILTPAATAFLVYSMAVLGRETLPAIISYVISAYMLTLWCVRIPDIIRFFKSFANTNKAVLRWRRDVRWRVNTSLFASFSWNSAYAIFQLCLAIYHISVWYFSAAAYYFSLAATRLFLVRHSRKHEPGERMREEWRRYRLCGWIFLMINIALAVMIAITVWGAKEFRHHQVTTIAMAAYTFASFTFAVINIFRYRKYNSPVFMASKSISLASASVSMLTLTSTMLTVFGNDGSNELLFRRLMLGLLGGGVSLLFIAMSVYMVVNGTKKLRNEIDNEQ